MRLTIPHPDGDRIWPESYLPIPRGHGFYVCPLDSRIVDPNTGEDQGENLQPWDSGPTGCLLTQPEHDPVFLVLFDLHYIDNDTTTIEGARDRLALLTDIVIHDARGYVKPQMGNAIIGLKNCADLHDWDKFIAGLEGVTAEVQQLKEQIQDEDLAEDRARQHDGYIKADVKEGKALVKKLLQGETKRSKKK